jgi:hypothetical protein
MKNVRYLFNVWLSIALCASTALFVSCGSGEDPDPDPEPEPEPPTVYENYIEFKFDGKDYQIANDENCIFTRHADDYYVVSGSTASVKQAFTLTVGQTIAQGGSYDIYTASPYVSVSIGILFTEEGALSEANFAVQDMSQVGVIGKLTITELTDERLAGTFSCKTTSGEMTNGKFSVRARVYD